MLCCSEGVAGDAMNETTVDSKYKIVRLLGQGGMGAVYEARHLGTGRRVALKVIIPSALLGGGDMLARFQREARASGAIDSQHVVQVLDTGIDPATASAYLVMEYLTGEDLQNALLHCGALPVGTALRVIGQACAGLVHAHGEGIIHRDIKTANIFIARREGGDLTVKILDFGIAKVRANPLSSSPDQALTRTGALLGSPLYMSPEQALGSKDIDARTDIYSLGATLYEALCGVTPNHECETFGKLVVAISSGKGMPLAQRDPSLPRDVTAIVDKALALEPSARFQTAAEMFAAITALLPRGISLNPSMIPPPGDVQSEAAAGFVVHTAPLLSPVPAPPSPSAISVEVPRAVGTTATTFTETNPEVARKTPRWMVVLPAAPLLVLCGLGFGVYELRRSSGASAPSAQPEASVAAPAPAPTPTQTQAAPEPKNSMAAVDVDASAAEASPAPTSAPVVAQPVQRQRPAGPATGSRPNCDVPYTFNSDGKKIWKRECL